MILGILIGWVTMFGFLYWWSDRAKGYYDKKGRDIDGEDS